MPTPAERLTRALLRRIPNGPRLRAHYRDDLLLPYFESGFAPPSLIEEIESDDEHKVWSFAWEAILFSRLRADGYHLRPTSKASGQQGPDFRIEHHDKTIWIEATVPEPIGIPTDTLEVPHEQMLLRCTNAVLTKRNKIEGHISKGIIGPNDCTVIAISTAQLSRWDIDGNGISQLPMIVEAVFPVGPLAVSIGPKGKLEGPAHRIFRFEIPKGDGKTIPTWAFLHEHFANVSAVIQGYQKHLIDRTLALTTVHNLLAANRRLPLGLFGRAQEFVATPDGDSYLLRDVAGGD
jgi:hypothetical protein